MKKWLKYFIWFYGFQILVVLCENIWYEVWRENILWFSYQSIDDVIVALTGVVYFFLYLLIQKITKNVRI